MKPFLDNPLILLSIPVRTTFRDLVDRLSKRKVPNTLLDTAREIYGSSCDISQPRALLYWLEVTDTEKDHLYLGEPGLSPRIKISTGYSSRFLLPARMAAVIICTIGPELETAAHTFAAEKQYLHSYLYEIMSMAVLEKTTEYINGIIEKEAAARDWGVGPLLSPGSVHGWELTDQAVLCSHLALDKIDVSCTDDGVLRPFNSLSFVVGIGPGYAERKISSPCTVCQNRDTCTESPLQAPLDLNGD